MKLSEALAGTQTALLASQFSGGFIRLFTGSAPAKPGAAETGVLLGIVSVDALAGAGLNFNSFGSSLHKADEVWAFKAITTGVVGYARIVMPNDDGTNSLVALRIDCSVVGLGVPGDMNWDSLNVTAGLLYTLDSFSYFIQPVIGNQL